MTEELKNKIIDLEKKLHQKDVRSNLDQLNNLLADDFSEIGTSGNCYSKADILEHLPKELDVFEIHSSGFNVREIAVGVVQVIYRSASGKKMSYRSSIWKSSSGAWKMVFHQGTKL